MSSPDELPDSKERFASDLRLLRSDAGGPTLESLARRTGVSKSVLSEAFAGKKLPSERTVIAITTEFHTDVKAWTARRTTLDPVLSDPRSASRRRGGRPALILTAVVALAIGLGVGSAGTLMVEKASASHASPVDQAPQIVVKNGTDPANTKCVNDAKVVASVTRTHDTQLQIIYSNACHAAWSRITRYDNQATGNEVSTSIYRKVAPNGADRQSTTEPDAQSAYTTLIVRPSPDTEICAVGSITVSGTKISLGEPICF